MKDFNTEGLNQELEIDFIIEELEAKIAPDDTLETVLPLWRVLPQPPLCG
jgi:hypothetical protein